MKLSVVFAQMWVSDRTLCVRCWLCVGHLFLQLPDFCVVASLENHIMCVWHFTSHLESLPDSHHLVLVLEWSGRVASDASASWTVEFWPCVLNEELCFSVSNSLKEKPSRRETHSDSFLCCSLKTPLVLIKKSSDLESFLNQFTYGLRGVVSKQTVFYCVASELKPQDRGQNHRDARDGWHHRGRHLL